MSHRRLVPVVAVGAGIAVLVAPALASSKPITKSFAVDIPVAGGAASNPTSTSACAAVTEAPSSVHRETFKAPAAGTLKVEVTGFIGDWDIALNDGKAKRLAEGDNASVTPTNMSTGSVVEKLTYKVKKAGDLVIVVCNFAGSPTGTGKYTFTPAK
ncbi:MAG TPA: hypothetical protein VNA14_07410 [Mycobacteriales bacterium]|nr:hypothetical protein [Mycobacteriales bacterium]